jgi:hypothetical protein
MKKILFTEPLFSLTGTTNAVIDYALANKNILKNLSYAAFGRLISTSTSEIHWQQPEISVKVTEALENLKKEMPVFLYNSKQELQNFINEHQIEYVYQQTAGDYQNNLFEGVKNCIHAVFPQSESNKHGDRYAFISSWLSEECSQNRIPFVPYIVNGPAEDLVKNTLFRDLLNIPQDATVFGRIGSYNEFNIDFVKEVIIDLVQKYNHLYFIFVNTKKFYDHPQIVHIPAINNVYEKFQFIFNCDAMIHARFRGETFGLAIAEFSSSNKPVLTFLNSYERAHIQALGDKGIYYSNNQELESSILNFKPCDADYNCYKQYNSNNVINQFNNVFLKD